jgi:hypothetical protein
MDRTIRVRRGNLLLMGWGTIMFGAMAGACYFDVMTRLAEQPGFRDDMLFMYGMTVFAVVMTGIFATVFAAYVKMKLVLREGRFEWTGLRGTVQAGLDEISAVRWRQGRIVLIMADGRKVKLDVHEYHAEDRAAAISFFRLNLPPEIQDGWEKFWTANWSVFDRADPSDPKLIAERAAFRRVFDVCFVVVGLVALCAGCIIFRITGDVRVSFTSLVVLLMWPIRYLPSVSENGRGPIARRLAEQVPPEPKRLGWASILAVTVLLTTCVTACTSIRFGIFSEPLEWTLIAVAALAMIAMLVCMARDSRPADLWRSEWNARASAAAEKEYLARCDADISSS